MEWGPIITATVDRCARAAYLTLSTSAVVRTEEFDDATLVDLDVWGRVVGIEFLDLAAEIPLEDILHRYRIS